LIDIFNIFRRFSKTAILLFLLYLTYDFLSDEIAMNEEQKIIVKRQTENNSLQSEVKVFISSTFYARIFCKKVLCTAFL